MRLAPRGLLVGREELLAEIHERLSEGDGHAPRILALHGLGGIGKTSLAIEYAHRHQATAGIVWQFPADDPAVMASEFSRLAAQLGVSGGVLDPRDPVASVHAVMAANPTPWLLIFDNALDQESIRDVLPPAGNGQVLITSQSALWPPSQAIEVPVLDTDVAAHFLTARTSDPDIQAATDLARELGGLPLALEQAAAYIQATANTVAGYIALFRERRHLLLDRGTAAGHPATVAATISLALARLDAEAPTAAALARLLACYAPEPVPLNLLLSDATVVGDLDPHISPTLAPLLDDPLAVGDALAALRRYSLVKPAEGGRVIVHRLVQAVTIAQMPAQLAGQWRQTAASVIEAAIPANTSQPEAWPICAMLLPHAQAALSDDSDGLARIAIYLGPGGGFVEARDLWRRIARAQERVSGLEHPVTLVARANAAHWVGVAGDASGARDQYAALLPVMQRILGRESPETLAARRNAANWTGQAGDPAGARDQYAALLPVTERVLGPEHRSSLAARNGLARQTGLAGDPAGARDQCAALLPVMQRVLGPDHLDTLATWSNLAAWTRQAGDAARARDHHAALLPVTRRVLGPEHPDTLATWANLASCMAQAGDAAGARDQYNAVLPVTERVFGQNDPRTLTVRANLADCMAQAGDAAGARDQYAALLPVMERLLGHEHSDTMGIQANLALRTGQAGDAAEAQRLYTALLPTMERVFGHDDPRTQAVRASLTDLAT